MKTKRILSAFICMIMVLSTLFVTVSAEENENQTEGINTNEDIPYFEALEFLPNAFTSGSWVKGETFSPTKLSYDLPIKTYSTSTLSLQSATSYDTEKYIALAEYTDINGEEKAVEIKSGSMTQLPNQPFDDSVMTITISDKNNSDNKTVYTFNISRPRDTTKKIKSSGIVLTIPGRNLYKTLYNGISEGIMQKADENGEITSGTGVSSSQMYYRTFVYGDAESFKLTLSASTIYAHIRYSTDNGTSWNYIGMNSGKTEEISLLDNSAEILVQILDDKTYTENINSGNDGFVEGEPAEYKLWIDKIELNTPKKISASTEYGDMYPAFSSDLFAYNIIDKNEDAPVLFFETEEGVSVKSGGNELASDEDGIYSLTLTTSLQTVTITSADGCYSVNYTFKYVKKSSFDVPDRITDYLCIGSQYTNGGFSGVGANPELNLSGSLKSLGNFGGYITYYYENPITDNPNNKYGMDFYVIGNSNEGNIASMGELGQVYVSEDGETWYALAGSEHYEDKAIWDYTITYTKNEDGKSVWTDNYGSVMTNVPQAWPSKDVYYFNDVPKMDTYTFKGILFKCRQGSITGDSTNASFAAEAKFGYTDYYASNISGLSITDVNPYIENPTKANGFDVSWAVDENGIPVDVSEKEFHYIKVATASNIWAGSFCEKSTEVNYVVRTTPQENEVGKTDAPKGVTISDGAYNKTFLFNDKDFVYDINVGNMKYISLTVNGTDEEDNIYINNMRVTSGNASKIFKITKDSGTELIRIIVQNGDKEPVIYLLRISGNAEESDEIIEGIKVNVNGAVREAKTKDGNNYTLSVGHRINSVGIVPVIAPDTAYTINDENASESYSLNYGDNVFEIKAENKTAVLTVVRDNAPAVSDNRITVRFALYGDEKHGTDEVHTYKNDKNSLPKWIEEKSYTVDSDASVLDVLEKALTEAGYTMENAGGNYITSINGLKEFDNGLFSGWMYLLNGERPNLGVAEQSLKDGDRIIFHYTDDYTSEKGSESFSSVGSGVPVKPKNENDKTDELKNENGNDKKNEQESAVFDKNTFKDVKEEDWYYEAVKYSYENKFMQGTDKGFEPNSDMKRAMLVEILYRMENTNYSGTSEFSDVLQGEWYFDSAVWAYNNKIINGVSKDKFAPNDGLTREQFALILYRYSKFKEYDTAFEGNLEKFTDKSEISDWSEEAVLWMVANGLLNGTGENRLSPKGIATRAQIATVLMRFLENIVNN